MTKITASVWCFLTLATPAWADDCKPAELVSVMEMMPLGDGRMLVPVTVNGAKSMVLLDTAAGVTTDSPGSAPLRPANAAAPAAGIETVVVTAERLHTFDHAFHTLSFGGINVDDPHFTVRPDRTGAADRENTNVLGSHVARVDDNLAPQVTIGMNILKKMRLYIQFDRRRMLVIAK